MEITPFTPKRFTESNLFLVRQNNQTFLLKTYIKNHATARRNLEKNKLEHWAAHQLPVPLTFQIPFPKIAEPYLIMELIDGQTLRTYLSENSVAVADKLQLLFAIFCSNAKRHHLALTHNDELLIHTDPNTDNILITNNGFYFIDFEHITKSKELLTAVAKEVAMFCRRVIKDIGRDQLDTVIGIMLEQYKDREITQQIIALTAQRPWQFIHRLKNWYKKKRNPHIITRYDVIDTIIKLENNYNVRATQHYLTQQRQT